MHWRESRAAIQRDLSNLEEWASRELAIFGKDKCSLACWMEKLKELTLCRPGEEKAKGRYNCWLQLPEWIHVFYIAPFLDSPWCTEKGRKTAVTNCTKRNSS